MDRIPKATLQSWHQELTRWHVPSAFRTYVEKIAGPQSIEREAFFNQAGLAFLRDAWIAARVATALSADHVRLVPDNRPDFELIHQDELKQFEATEADQGERRRGDEPSQLGWQPDPVERWRERFRAIPAALDRVVQKKIEKNYPPGVSLAIYLNLGCYGAYVQEGLPILRDRTAPAAGKFKAVFVLWEGILYKLWENGSLTDARWQLSDNSDF